MAKKFLSGNEAFAEGIRLAKPQVISAYPITPQTIVVEKLSEMVEDGSLKSEFIHVESEHSALSCAMGASAVGARAFTATSSQGLLYMAECLPYASGGRFPIVMMNANRSTALPWNIYGDQRDSISQLDCGWIQAYAVDAQEALDLGLMSYYIAEKKDVSTPFMANLIGLVTNMILDPVLILGPGPFPKLGVTGAAIATVTAQAIVMSIMILGIIARKKENVLKGTRLFAKIPAEFLRGICRIGIPTAIQGMAYCGISMILTRMVSGYGAEAVATQRVGGQIESISWNTADGFAAALNAFVAQNYGAGERERVRKGYQVSLWTVGIWGVLVSAVFICFPNAIADIFFHEPKAVATAVGYLVIIGFSEAFMCVELTTIGALSGLGRTRLCSVISIVLTSARIPLAIVLSGIMGLDGIWWALTSTSIVKGIIFTCTFFWIMREKSV